MESGGYILSTEEQRFIAENQASYSVRKPKLFDLIREVLRSRHYSRRSFARAGLTKRTTCHTFRHSFATQHSDFSAIKLETTPYSQESYMVLEAIIGGLYGST